MNLHVFFSYLGVYIDSFPGGYVTIWWDIMNETRGSYSANVTIIDNFKNHDIEGPWTLTWEWLEDEILLSTVGVIGTQLGNDVSVGDNKWPLNNNLPLLREKVVPKCCKDDVIPSWCIETDLEKSSSSFQITVGRVGTEYYPPQDVVFKTPRSGFMCFSTMPFSTRRGYSIRYPGEFVTISWDIMNETRGSYSANVTIIDYSKNHDTEGPWALSWEWTEDEILLSTVGVARDNNRPLDSNVPPRKEKVVPKCSEDDVDPFYYREDDLAESSYSFQITVGRVGIEYYPPEYLEVTTPRSELHVSFTNGAIS
ncbi:unnamed protein product [Eruca vesicaria subsp. sativa]|uniref:Uncharacterized protein n=1 Tax=Eruca vesicaria subsp. sativa TaxID=29727 RepID=A0ABC8KYW0_ERUVS|nr:unnamed protein product [Eruca vesicaria subsp. sativa]